MNSQNKSDALYWLLGILFGAACGYVHIRVQDSSLSVLMVTGFTMFLAYKRPDRVWRWAVLMGLSMPAAGLIALLTKLRPSRGVIVGTFAGLAFSIVAAVGGRVLHRGKDILFPDGINSRAKHRDRPALTSEGEKDVTATNGASNRVP